MKKYLILVVVYLISLACIAQQDYDWIERGISITLPNDFEEPVMSSESFSSHGDGMTYEINVVNDNSIDERHINKFALDIAKKINFELTSKIHKVDVHGFVASYAQGKIEENSYYLLGMIDPDSHIHFYILVSFESFDEVEIEEALDILLSVRST